MSEPTVKPVNENLNYNNLMSIAKHNVDDFSFVKTLNNLAVNSQFTEGYTSNCDDNYTLLSSETPDSYIWHALSAVGENLGEIIYGNITNYIDLVSNVNLCKIKSLKSMIEMLGIHYTIFDNIEFLPQEILQLFDVLTINKCYLLNDKILNKTFVETLSTEITIPSTVTSDISTGANAEFTSDGYSEEKFKNCLSTIFTNVIKYNINLQYDDTDTDTDTIIYKYLSNDLLDPTVTRYNKDEILYNDQFRQFKLKYGIDLTFNEQEIVDNIDNGLDFLHNYFGTELELLKMEQARRAEAFSISKLTTRYKYYKEQKVKEYFSFVEDKLFNANEELARDTYKLNKNLIEIDVPTKKYLLTYDPNNNTYEIDNTMIKNVVNTLVNMTICIRDIREKVKTQSQRTYMKGTFNLLSYVINEYLNNLSLNDALRNEFLAMISNVNDDSISNSLNKIDNVINHLSTSTIDNVNIIEYYDKTEYFNLETDTTLFAKNKNYVNPKFWEEILSLTSNTANKENPKYSLAFNDIEQYYLNILDTKNCMSSTAEFVDFLSTVYSIGANNIYIDEATERPVYNDMDEYINIFENYSNSDYGKYPFYNHKNVTHSSYQVHPYLYNLVEITKYIYPIKNAFLNSYTDAAIEELTKNNISTYIGEYGETINMWLHNSLDYTGYSTLYESTAHTNENEIENYSGAFYPPAIETFLNTDISAYATSANFINSDLFNKYYSNLHLTDKNIEYIRYQLSCYHDNLLSIVLANSDIDKYDIYKYSKDYLGNHYILYKNYNTSLTAEGGPTLNKNTFTFNDDVTKREENFVNMQNTCGELWIRLKDHPIAFPALYGQCPNIAIDDDEFNGRFANIAFGDNSNDETEQATLQSDRYRMSYFYDFEFDTNRKTLYLVTCPFVEAYSTTSRFNGNIINDIKNEDKFTAYQKYEYSSITVTDVLWEYDIYKEYNVLKFKSIRNKKEGTIVEDTIDHPNITNKTSALSEYNFYYKGMYSDNMSDVFIYIQKPEIVIDEIPVTVKIYEVNQNSGTTVYTKQFSIKLPENYELIDDSINNFKFSVYKNQITFIIQVKNIQEYEYEYENYNGNLINYYGKSNVSVLGGDNLANNQTSYSSFNKFETSLGLINVTIGTNYNIIVNNIRFYNLHADPSYIPAYPGQNTLSNGIGDNLLDLTSVDLYKDEQINAIQLLGHSQNTLSNYINYVNALYNITEDDVSKIDVNFKYDIQTLSTMVYGRIYEDYDDNLIYKYFQINEIPLINSRILSGIQPSGYYDPTNKCFIWKISLNTFFEGVPDDNKFNNLLSDINILLFNTNCNGKNIYCHDTLSSLNSTSSTANILYNNVNSNYADVTTVYNAISINLIGTYNYFDGRISKNNLNYINGISSIDIDIERDFLDETHENYSLSSASVIIKFNIDNSYYNGDNLSNNLYIDVDLVKAVIYNKNDLRSYAYYSLLDPKPQLLAVSSTSDDSYSPSYYLSNNISTYLSDINLFRFSNLSDIPFFNGYDSVSFKYQEGIVFDRNNIQYFYPGYNTNYPWLPVHLLQMYKSKDFTLGDGTLIDSLFNNLFNENNLFIVRLKTIDLSNDIGNIKFAITDTNDYENCIRVYENYMDGGDQYSLYDPEILQYIKFTEDTLANMSSNNIISTEISGNIEYYLSETLVSANLTGNGTAKIINMLSDLSGDSCTLATEAYRSQEVLYETYDFDSIWQNVTVKQNKDINNFLNIYVNYVCNTDGTITLYFNYYNYLNSPFNIINEDNKLEMTIIPGTYLKLDENENGILDIIIQVTIINSLNIIYVCQNIHVASYQIYNISHDRKPKFVIIKYYELIKNSIGYSETELDCDIIVTASPVFIPNNTIISDVTVTIDINTVKKLKYLDFVIDYDRDLLNDVNNLPDVNPYNKLSVIAEAGSLYHVRTVNDIMDLDGLTYGRIILKYNISKQAILTKVNSGVIKFKILDPIATTIDDETVHVNIRNNEILIQE